MVLGATFPDSTDLFVNRFKHYGGSESANIIDMPCMDVLAARWLRRPAASSLSATTGCYYIVRLPLRWLVIAFREDEFPGEPGHVELWMQECGLAEWLARQWAAPLGKNPRRLVAELSECWYGFPRGRVTQSGSQYQVRHGADLTRKMNIPRLALETLFGINSNTTRKTKWICDEHERCQQEDVNFIRRLLRISETWNAVQ